MSTIIVVERSVGPNESLLEEEIESLGLGSFYVGYTKEYPGQVAVTYTDDDLTDQQITDVENTIINHDETQQSSKQQRLDQDTIDLDDLRNAHDNWDTLTDAEKDSYHKKAVRMALRGLRSEPI